MNRSAISTKIGLAALLLILLAGCATPYERRSDGVYAERTTRSTTAVVYVDPLIYPYWSLDYFYFSRYYYPYSVVVQRYDPWYFPFPGWYYGYRPGPAAHIHVGYRSYYPWQRYPHYAHYRPWWVDNRFAFGYRYEPNVPRIRQLDSRLRDLQTSRSLAIRAQRPDRTTVLVPAASPVLPATARRPTGPYPQAVRSSQREHSAPAASRAARTHHEQVIERLQRAPRAPNRETPPTRSQVPVQRQRDGIELPTGLRTDTAPRSSRPGRTPEPSRDMTPRITPPPASGPAERSRAPIEAGPRTRTAPPAQQRVTPAPIERRASPPPLRERSGSAPVRLPERQTPRSAPSRDRGGDRGNNRDRQDQLPNGL